MILSHITSGIQYEKLIPVTSDINMWSEENVVRLTFIKRSLLITQQNSTTFRIGSKSYDAFTFRVPSLRSTIDVFHEEHFLKNPITIRDSHCCYFIRNIKSVIKEQHKVLIIISKDLPINSIWFRDIDSG
jgi:hypothetical protein